MATVDYIELFRETQGALRTIAALMLTAYLFPPQARVVDNEEFDFIIVGGGSAGSVIADRLSEIQQFRVLLIDAGGDPPFESLTPALYPYLHRTQYDWNITSEKEGGPECSTSASFNLTSGKVLGGGSSFNYLLYDRGVPTDYNKWAATTGYKTWNWDGVYPYFKKSENLQSKILLNSTYRWYHGTRGFLKVTREKGHDAIKYLEPFGELHDILPDINGEQILGYTLSLFTTAGGIRQATAYTNLAKNKHRHNLHVLKHTQVTEIIFDENNNAVGVKATLEDNSVINIRVRKEVIVSAGALHSPQLLMLSGIGPKEQLEALNITVRSDLPVGHDYNDHVVSLVAIAVEDYNQTAPPIVPGIQPSPTFTGYVALDENKKQPTYQTINSVFSNAPTSIAQFCEFSLSIKHYICENLYKASVGKKILLTAMVLLHPKSRGILTLRSKDPKIPPRICTGTFADENDLETLASSIIDFLQVLNTSYFITTKAELVDLKPDKCGKLNITSREYWKCYIREILTTIFHYTGTCSLGKVVDSELRVFNVTGLRVADASIMPSLVSANTNAPVITIAEKISDMIKGDSNGHSQNLPAPGTQVKSR